MNINDVIVALATAEGRGAISVFRISGKELMPLLGKVLPLDEVEPRKIKKTFLRDHNGDIIDEVTFIKYIAPNSFTGEDMVEVFSHGGIANSKRILKFFANCGLRIAEPGEFTFRAFLNGKITLTKAESIDKICSAENLIQINSALEGLSGNSGKEFERIYQMFIELYSDLVAEVEFFESDFDFDMYKPKVRVLMENVEALIKSYECISLFADGADVVIAGKTNVGKSSLFNRLIGEERAIVTDIEGTTRDVIDKKVYFGNILVRFADTAGLRQTGDIVELIGQKKTREEIEKATIILYMTDVEKGFDELDKEIINKYKGKVILVVNKIDIFPHFVLEDFEDVIYISAKYGHHLDKLKEKIKTFILQKVDYNCRSLVFNKRQYDLLVNVLTSLRNAYKAIEEGLCLDVVISELSVAKRFLENLIGKCVDEDVYTNIFSRFCIGK